MVLLGSIVAASAASQQTPAQLAPFHMGRIALPQADGGSTTLFFPTRDDEAPVRRGPFELSWAQGAAPARGNGRLLVISHGSGGSPWVHADLARVLVQRGFVVAIPQHHGDNHMDPSDPGPVSWVKRPGEVGRAIDAVAGHAPLAGLLSFEAVGVFGGSAGGHTALTLAGGEWSFRRFLKHCEQRIEQDFSSCVGMVTRLRGNWLDGPKLWLARRVIAWRFDDETPRRHVDSRVKAVVAMVPFAADFDPVSLARPAAALGLVIADQDVNQVPLYHVEAILRACEPHCEVIMRLPEAGHGAMLSPMPPLEPGSVGHHLLSDPEGFDRAAALPLLHERIAEFFIRKLAAGAP